MEILIGLVAFLFSFAPTLIILGIIFSKHRQAADERGQLRLDVASLTARLDALSHVPDGSTNG
jgi:hypothetical protein